MDKIDIHLSSQRLERAIKNLKEDVSKENNKLIKDFIDAAAIGKTARKNAYIKQVGERGRLRYVYLLKTAANSFNKPLNKISVKDMEKFIKDLNENNITKDNGENYSEQTKSNIKINLISFLRYYIKDSSKLAELTDWIQTSFKKKDVQELSEDSIKKMLNKCVTLHQKAIICILFDSGCRAEEFLNIRIGDVTEVQGEIPYYKLLIRNEFSKTQGRTINLLWKPSTEILREYLSEHQNKNDLESPLFDTGYPYVRKILNKIGQKALGRNINPHLFRHSSATYYASQGYDYFQICKRYGWSIGSKTPHVYINKSGIQDKQQVEKFINTNVKDLNEKLELTQKKNLVLNELLQELVEKVAKIEKDVESNRKEEKLFGKVLVEQFEEKIKAMKKQSS